MLICCGLIIVALGNPLDPEQEYIHATHSKISSPWVIKLGARGSVKRARPLVVFKYFLVVRFNFIFSSKIGMF